MRIDAVVYGLVPSKSNSYRCAKDSRTGETILVKTKALRTYEKNFKYQINRFRDANITGKFRFEWSVWLRNPAQDLDGTAKILLDILQDHGVIKNDKMCYELEAKKHIDKLNPRVQISIIPL